MIVGKFTYNIRFAVKSGDLHGHAIITSLRGIRTLNGSDVSLIKPI